MLVGSRFALMETKALVYHLLLKFSFEIAENTQIPLNLIKFGVNTKAEGGYNIHLKPRCTNHLI